MPTVTHETLIHAPREVCFDLARDVGFHTESMRHTGERVVGGRADGLLELGDDVIWEGRHFGVRQRLAARITAFDRPRRFQDEMQRGAFAVFSHAHEFREEDGRTVMLDRLSFRSPLGPLGWLVDHLVMKHYLRRLIAERAEALRSEAEARIQRGV